MGDRKVVNKYIPADFDPSKVPRTKKPKDGLVSVRMMLPFSIQCSTCSTFMYRGRKFNSKKEAVSGPNGTYLGIQRFRFYVKCTACSRPVTFLTDPEHADYEMESGATRNYEVYKDEQKTREQQQEDEQQEETLDSMKALENRVLESQREMQELDHLEEIKAMNARHAHLQAQNGSLGNEANTVEMARQARASQQQQQQQETLLNEDGLTQEEEALVQSIQFGKKQNCSTEIIKRLNKEDEEKLEEKRKKDALALEQQLQQDMANKTKAAEKKKTIVPIIKAKRKRIISNHEEDYNKKNKTNETNVGGGGALGSLLGGYGSSDSDSD